MNSSRNASLDGLRGIAVLLVLFYHHGLLNSGWLGVDLFFALSGFLITHILRRERASEHYWRIFWTKRVLRIGPPLLLVIVLTNVLSFAPSKSQTVAYLLSFGDVLAYLRPDYEPLRVLWSLAVEEHFYLVWPLAIRYLRRGALIKILIALLVVEPIIRSIASVYTHKWEVIYFLTPFRLDGLALGALMAISFESAGLVKKIRRWCLPAGVCSVALWLLFRLMLGAAFTRDNPTVAYNAFCYTLVAAASVCGVAYLLTHPESWIARILGAPSLAWIGLISYGLYLYQVPIHEAVLRAWPALGRASLLVDLPLTFILAVVSFYAVEQPAMMLGRSRSFVTPQPTADRLAAPAR